MKSKKKERKTSGSLRSLGVSGFGYPPLKLGTEIRTGQIGFLILRIETGTNLTSSQDLETGTSTTGSVLVPGYPLQPLVFLKKQS